MPTQEERAGQRKENMTENLAPWEVGEGRGEEGGRRDGGETGETFK